MEALATDLAISINALEERLGNLVDLVDLKKAFEIPLVQLNGVIERLGGHYKPISNESLHRETWARYLRQRQPETLETLRQRAVGAFDLFETLTDHGHRPNARAACQLIEQQV